MAASADTSVGLKIAAYCITAYLYHISTIQPLCVDNFKHFFSRLINSKETIPQNFLEQTENFGILNLAQQAGFQLDRVCMNMRRLAQRFQTAPPLFSDLLAKCDIESTRNLFYRFARDFLKAKNTNDFVNAHHRFRTLFLQEVLSGFRQYHDSKVERIEKGDQNGKSSVKQHSFMICLF